MSRPKNFKSFSIIMSLVFILSLALVFSACATQGGMKATPEKVASSQPPGPPAGGPKPDDTAKYKVIPITMEMEAGAALYKEWPGGGKTIHAGIGWIRPLGRSEYVAGLDFPETKKFPAPSYFNDEFMATYGAKLFCIYRLADGEIYAYDGIVGNLEPENKKLDDGKEDYLINVIVGGTGAYEGATGMLLGRTPGRGHSTEVAKDVKLPVSILKLMSGYIRLPKK